MTQELHLGVEFRRGFDPQQLFPLGFQARLHLVEARVDDGNGVDDPGGLGGIGDFQVADDFDQQFQFLAHRVGLLLNGRDVGHLLHRVDCPALAFDLAAVKVQRILPQQKRHAGLGSEFGLFLQGSFQQFGQRQVRVAQFPERNHHAAQAPQVGQQAHVLVDVFEDGLFGVFAQFPHFLGRCLGLLLRVPADLGYFLEFVDGPGGGGADLGQGQRRPKGLRLVEPMVGIQNGTRFLDQVHVQAPVHVFAANQVQHVVALGHRPHDVLVADLVEVAFLLHRGCPVGPDVGRLPDLDRVVLGGFAGGLEVGQLAVGKQRKAVANQGILYPLLDQVVGKQDVGAQLIIVEHVQKVFPVGRGNALFEPHLFQQVVELLQLTRLQVIAVGKNQPLSVRQQDARVLDGIHADGFLKLIIVNDVAVSTFLIRFYFQQHQVA